MKRSLIAFAIALIAIIAGCTGSNSNPLLGTWVSTTPPTAYGAGGCPTHYVFTSDTQTLTTGGHDVTDKVSYTVEPNLVFVNMQMGSNGFKFTSPNTAEWSTGSCTYRRA